MAGMKLSLLADVKPFVREFQKAGDSVEDLGDELVDMGRLGEGALDDVEQKLKDLPKAAKAANDAVGKGGKEAFTKLAQSADDGVSKAKQSIREVGSEAKQNAAETLSSFDGSITSVASGVQGTMGGLVAGLAVVNPLLAAGAAAGAIAFGVLNSKMADSKEAAEKAEQEVSDLTDALVDAGGQGTIAIGDIVTVLKEMAAVTEDGERSLKDIATQAVRTGIPFAELADVFAGNNEALQDSIDITKQKIASDEAMLTSETNSTGRFTDNYNRRIEANKLLLTDLEALEEQYTEAARNEALYLETNAEKYETKASLIESIDTAYDNAAGAVSDFLSEETGLFDVSKYIAAMDKRAKALKGYQNNLIKADLPPEALTFLNEQGADVAAAMVQGYVDTSPANRKKLLRIWTEAGKDASGAIDKKVTAVVDATYAGPTIKPVLDSRAYENGLRKLKTGFNVPVTFRARNGTIIQ